MLGRTDNLGTDLEQLEADRAGGCLGELGVGEADPAQGAARLGGDAAGLTPFETRILEGEYSRWLLVTGAPAVELRIGLALCFHRIVTHTPEPTLCASHGYAVGATPDGKVRLVRITVH